MINLNSLTKNIKDGFKAPTGDSNRETPTKGALRFNTETGKPEIYAKGRGWRRASVSEISAIYTHDNLVAFYDASNADTTGDTSDQYYSDVELLLHMNGTDGSTTFTDSSSSNRSASNSGASIETEQFKFGGSSAYFDGNDYLSYSSFPNFGSTDFTIETWFYRTGGGYLPVITKTDENSPNGNLGWRISVRSDNAKIDFRGSSNGGSPSDSAVLLQSSTITTTNTWYHVAVTWDGSTYRLFVDGTLEASDASSTAIYNTAEKLRIGTSWNNGSTWGAFEGYIDESRITIGTARYTADFTPQTREFYPGTGITDITSNSIDMVSRNPSNISLNLTEPKSYDFVKGTGGSQGIISSVNNSSLPLLSSDYTISAWVFINSEFTSLNNRVNILSFGLSQNDMVTFNKIRSGIGNNVFAQVSNGGISNYVDLNLINSSNDTNQWLQLVFTRSGNDVKFYINASLIDSGSFPGSGSGSTSQTELILGSGYDAPIYGNIYSLGGKISLAKVYDSALSQADITSEFNYHKSTFGL